MNLRFIPLLVVVLCAAASCAVLRPAQPAPPGAPSAGKAPPIAGAKGASKPERPNTGESAQPGSELAGAAFSKLPVEAETYLVRFAQAVRSRDAAFLLAQGEADYARRTKAATDDERYLALLFRAGSDDGRDELDRPVRLAVSALHSVRFTGWSERGPVAEMRGVLRLLNGTELPVGIALLWRLEPPKILGAEL